MKLSAQDRFWAKVQKGDGCWEWTAALLITGYGHFRGHNGQTIKAHRFAWIETNGPIPDGLNVLHRCDNPKCVRPSHLFLGTKADNSRDMAEKGRSTQGIKDSQAKLDDDKVRLIRQQSAEGVSQPEIANRFGIDKSNVSRIVNRKTWKHVE